MAESLNFTIQLPVYPERVYRAWLDGGELGKITGKPAKVESRDGGKFSALNGGVEGEILSRTPHDKIVQSWRTSDFPAGSQASNVELRFEPTCTGTELVLNHTGIPDGMSQKMLSLWENEILRPISRYFDELVGEYVADMGDG